LSDPRGGLLHLNQLQRKVIPMFARSEKDFRAPFVPSGRFQGSTISRLEASNAEDRFWARFQSDGDAETFGAQWAAFARAALFPALAGTLDGGVSDPRAA
jgi:salicylate 1-O-methyltransferase